MTAGGLRAQGHLERPAVHGQHKIYSCPASPILCKYGIISVKGARPHPACEGEVVVRSPVFQREIARQIGIGSQEMVRVVGQIGRRRPLPVSGCICGHFTDIRQRIARAGRVRRQCPGLKPVPCYAVRIAGRVVSHQARPHDLDESGMSESVCMCLNSI